MVSHARRSGPGATRFVVAGLALALGGSFLGACGSSSSAPGSATATTSSPATTAPSPAATKVAIEHAYSVLFDLADPAVAPKLAVVQGGTALGATFAAALHTSLAKKAAGAKVTSIKTLDRTGCSNEALPSPCAEVTYSILGPNGAVLLANSKGFALYSSGTWRVAKVTICTLLALAAGGKTPSGC